MEEIYQVKIQALQGIENYREYLEAERRAEEAKRKAKALRERKAREMRERIARIKRSYSLPVLSYRLTARFGQRSGLWSTYHTGLDFAASVGRHVHAVTAGRIIAAGWAGAYGNRLILRHADGTESWYCHLSGFLRSSGRVAVGQSIGLVGATGNVTGPHLHLEIRPHGGGPVDPYSWLAARYHRP